MLCTGLHLGLWVTAHCPGHSKPAPAWLIPSDTGYLSRYWSTYLDNRQHPQWRDTFPSGLTEVASRGWGLVPFFQLSCQCPLPWPGITAAWLPCPLIPSYLPCYPNTGAAKWQCAHNVLNIQNGIHLIWLTKYIWVSHARPCTVSTVVSG